MNGSAICTFYRLVRLSDGERFRVQVRPACFHRLRSGLAGRLLQFTASGATAAATRADAGADADGAAADGRIRGAVCRAER